MYSIEQIFKQALEDPSAYNIDNSSIVNYGVKIQKFFLQPAITKVLLYLMKINY